MRYIFACLLVLVLTIGNRGFSQDQRITDSLLALLQSMPEDTSKINTLRTLFNQYRNSDFQKSQDVAQQELRLALKLKDVNGEATAYRHLGIAYSSRGSSVKAIDFYLKAIRLYEKIDQKFFVAACYNNIGNVYIDLKQWEKANANLNKAIQIWQPLSDGEEGIAIALSNLGSVYMAQHQDGQAMNYYNRAIEVARKIDLPDIICEAQTNIAGIYVSQKDYATASCYLTQTLPVAIKISNNEILTQIYYYQSKVAAAQNQQSVAISKAKQSLDLAKKISYSQWMVKCYDQLAKLYLLQENYKQGAYFQSLYIALNDSLDNVEQTLTVEKLQYEYQLEKRDLINQSLVKDKILQEEKIAQDDIKKKGVFVLLLVFVATTLFYRIIYQRQKRMNLLLAQQQQEIQGQNEEIKQQNEHILLQRENLAKANVALNKLFGIIAHDLQAPFRSIKGIMALFEDDLLDADEMQNATRKLSDRVNKTSELLENLLQWSKSQLHGFEVHQEIFKVCEVVDKSVSTLEMIAGQKHVHLKTEVPESLHAYADPDMINTVLRNLVANAIKFSKSGDVVWIRAEETAKHISVLVEDTGQGMDQETQEKVLNPNNFYSTLGTTGEKGTGMGIHLCQDFLALNGGVLTIRSAPGQGSTFIFTLPRQQPFG